MTEVFVFGSNLAGRHGRGAALSAFREHGAIYGIGEGMQGNSYAIPTKDAALRVLPLNRIAESVEAFLAFARSHPEMVFRVTAIGTGLAGYQPSDIAWMFRNTPENCRLPSVFLEQFDET